METAEGFEDIRRKVNKMLSEFSTIDSSSPFSIGDVLWGDIYSSDSPLKIVRSLSDEQLLFIRAFTGLFTQGTDDGSYQEIHSLAAKYDQLTQNIPDEYHCGEPVPSKLYERFGFYHKNNLINRDIVRYQRTVTNLYNTGLLKFDNNPDSKRKYFYEIGGGYGALAHQVSRIIGSNFTYVIIDLPGSLFLSSIYLRIVNPNKSIYLFDRDDFDRENIDKIMEEHDFVLLPHYILDEIEKFPPIDVAINLLSFPEMKESQLRYYFEFLSKNLDGWLYSENMRINPWHNKNETKGDFYKILSEFFEVIPNFDVSLEFGNTGRDHDVEDRQNVPQLYVELATPKSKPAVLFPVIPKLLCDGYEMELKN